MPDLSAAALVKLARDAAPGILRRRDQQRDMVLPAVSFGGYVRSDGTFWVSSAPFAVPAAVAHSVLHAEITDTENVMTVVRRLLASAVTYGESEGTWHARLANAHASGRTREAALKLLLDALLATTETARGPQPQP
jgi:hypothetical protein